MPSTSAISFTSRLPRNRIFEVRDRKRYRGPLVCKRVFVIATFFDWAFTVIGVAQPTYIERNQDARKQDAAPCIAAAA